MKLTDLVSQNKDLAQAREILKPLFAKLQKLFPKDLSQMSAQELSTALSSVNTELTSLTTALIQLKTKIEQKEKEVNEKFEQLKTKFGVTSLEDLMQKKAGAVSDFNSVYAELMKVKKEIEESDLQKDLE